LKLLLIILLLAVVAVGTIPLWGSCDLKHQACTTICEVRHLDSDVNRASCKARCAVEKAGCLAGVGTEEVGRLLQDPDR